MSEKFIRARSAVQKSQRQEQLLEAARCVIERLGVDASTMADMAKEAGISQSAFYRYFGSKEEILAHLLVAEADKISDILVAGIKVCRGLPQLADVFAKVFADHPLFCALASDLTRTLERNISQDRLVKIKVEFARVLGRWSEALLDAEIVKDRDTAVSFIRNAHVVLAGLWPMTLQRPHVKDAARQAGLAEISGNFQTEFSKILAVVGRGMEK